MGDLGSRPATGRIDQSNPYLSGGWTVAFTPEILALREPFEVYHIAVQGPTNSRFRVYIDDMFYDAAVRGDINSWDPNQAMRVGAGSTLFFYYNVATNPPPRIRIYLRQPVR